MVKDQLYYLQIARLHAKSIDQGFLSTLGEDFLAILYESIDTVSGPVLLTEIKNGRVIGFISGACSLAPIYKRMLLKWPRLVVALLPVLLHPKKLIKVFELLWHTFSKDTDQNSLPKFELLSIAVENAERRGGVAYRLYQRLIKCANDQKLDAFKIVVGYELKAAHEFYLRMGAIPTSELRIHAGRKSVVYIQIIRSD